MLPRSWDAYGGEGCIKNAYVSILKAVVSKSKFAYDKDKPILDSFLWFAHEMAHCLGQNEPLLINKSMNRQSIIFQ